VSTAPEQLSPYDGGQPRTQLAEQGLLNALQPEWFVDHQLADRLAESMVELIVSGVFDQPPCHGDERPPSP
jgi:hypothetical protein